MAAESPSPQEPSLEARIQDVADRFLVDVRSGRGTSVKSVVEAHPDLAPELVTRLALISALLRAKALPPEDSGVPDASDLPSHLGRFQIVARIGSGTFGEVLKANDPELGRAVALKVPRAGFFSSADEEERFFREARSAAHLKHPAIVQVHEIGRHGDLPFIVCDLIEGETLASRLARQPPSSREAAELLAQVADALDFAHRLKIIHRDIKPQNILLNEAGRPHVADFGLARREDDESQMTLDGQVLGTPAYMPPEQAAGQRGAADGRSDVYSLGVVLYELLVGERPFRGDRSVVVHQVLHAEPRPPRTVNESIPRDLETICLKAMAKEPGRRYPTAGAMAADLRAFLRGEPILARPARAPERVWRWCRRNPVSATMAALVLLLLVGTAVGSSVAVLWVNQARKEATAALAESRRQLVHMTVASGQRHLQLNDAMGALL